LGICLFPTNISALDRKNPSFLEKGVKNGGKQTNSKKKVLPEWRAKGDNTDLNISEKNNKQTFQKRIRLSQNLSRCSPAIQQEVLNDQYRTTVQKSFKNHRNNQIVDVQENLK
jgi:hypothetical protein